MTTEPLLSVKNVVKRFDISGGLLEQLKWQDGGVKRKRTIVRAVNNVSFDILPGETLSLVGESGCGKSTMARVTLGVYPPEEGEILYHGERIDNLSSHDMLPYRTKMQMVFQDPYASLNPRMKVSQILEEPVKFHNKGVSKSEVGDRVAKVMLQVGLDPAWAGNYPHEFSGGQRQRISIARALTVDPEFIVADEPISALDVSIQAQILNLMMDMQEERGLTYLFISHDLSVVEHISTRVAVMYLGTLCELTETDKLFDTPRHPYTRILLSAIPRLGKKGGLHSKISGDVPSPIHLPPGCVFHGRCPHCFDRCKTEIPAAQEVADGHFVACHAVEEGKVE